TLRPQVPGAPGKSVLSNAVFLDADNILFLAATTGANGEFDYDVYQMRVGSEHVERLTKGNGFSYALSVSGDSKTAVFAKRSPTGKSEVWLLDLTTRRSKLLNVTGMD